MKAVAVRSSIRGIVNAPSSKSAVQRYIAAALMSEGISIVNRVTLCDDSEAAMEIAKALGAELSVSEGTLTVHGGFKPSRKSIFCGESGLSARMFTPIAALHNEKIVITGKGSVLKRPFDMVEAPLGRLGVEVESHNGFLPLSVKGPMRGGEVTADGSVSSQFITGMLMALPCTLPDSRLRVKNLVSRPYIDLTIKILNEFEIEIENLDYTEFNIRGGQKFKAGNFFAEGDWSGAAFLLVMGAIAGEVSVAGLDINSPQADKAVLKALSMAGAMVKHSGNSIKVNGGKLKPFEFNISDCPDLAPPLTVLALSCHGRTLLTGAGRLAAKESDRGLALEKTMTDIGARVVNHGDYVEIEGGLPLKGGASDSFNDHRIAMALASAALLCESPVTISGMECINKSYPGFINDYMSLGGKLKMV